MADHVVLAIRCKILRQVAVRIDLPTVKERAINGLGHGQNIACMTAFRNRPWRDHGSFGLASSGLTSLNCWDSALM